MLQEFTEQARRAYYWTSFDPERRGESTINEAEAELESDIAKLKAGGAGEEEINSFIERFKRLFSSWLGARSRCASSMIAGPSNFNVRRAQKANRSEERHYEVFQEWRKKAVKAIIRKAQGPVTFNSELEKLEAQLKDRERSQEYMKIINKHYRAFKKNPASLESAKIHSEAKEFIKNFVPRYSFQPDPYAGYQMSNNLANIKRIKGRIEELKAKEAARNEAPGGEKEYPFAGGVVVVNYELNRVQIKFPGKPSPEKISELKSKAFRWAPSEMAWQRILTPQALYAAAYVSGIPSSELK